MNYLLDKNGNRMYVGDRLIYNGIDGNTYTGEVQDHSSDDILSIQWDGAIWRLQYNISYWNSAYAPRATKEGGVHKRFEFG